MKTIKRYANRKLYDTEKSCYVTLDEISSMVQQGEEIRIVDQKTNEDLTSVTLAQILLEEQKKSRRFIPLAAWQKIIQTGGEILQRIAVPVQQFSQETQRSMDRLLRPGEVLDEGRQTLREIALTIQRAIEEMQRRIDERIREAVDGLTNLPALDKNLEELHQILEAQEKHLQQLSRRLDRLEHPDQKERKPSSPQEP
ncbi:MAG: hypothetical protein JW797_05445 [Bradymonadales bacterium]|nr:hypothetical protein [Bradymonadales bacterium]